MARGVQAGFFQRYDRSDESIRDASVMESQVNAIFRVQISVKRLNRNKKKKYRLRENDHFRMSRLPAGVDGTLMILQVSLRDREWSCKIDNGEQPMYSENDLSLMYSTTIMRFLNHITSIGRTKQRSLYQTAKHLRIPNWIVALRHSAAHGHELHPLGVLRLAINTLFDWIHVCLFQRRNLQSILQYL